MILLRFCELHGNFVYEGHAFAGVAAREIVEDDGVIDFFAGGVDDPATEGADATYATGFAEDAFGFGHAAKAYAEAAALLPLGHGFAPCFF